VFGGKLWVCGGFGFTSPATNDVWCMSLPSSASGGGNGDSSSGCSTSGQRAGLLEIALTSLLGFLLLRPCLVRQRSIK
jgi:hypothetical protein